MKKLILLISILIVNCSQSVLFTSSCVSTETESEYISDCPHGKLIIKKAKNSLISVLNSSPTCFNGGITLLSGIDENYNTILDSYEISTTTPLCNGLNGSNGTNGANGHNALVELLSDTEGGGAGCVNGGITVLAGTDHNDDSILQLSEIVSSNDICNGTNGVNSSSPFLPVELIDPCGDSPNLVDEVFIKFSNGTILASFSENPNGKNTRFSVLYPGNFITTDGSNCYFSVDSNNQVYNEHY